MICQLLDLIHVNTDDINNLNEYECGIYNRAHRAFQQLRKI